MIYSVFLETDQTGRYNRLNYPKNCSLRLDRKEWSVPPVEPRTGHESRQITQKNHF